MLLIFGFKIRLTTIESLEFFCPVCGGDRPATRRSARRWFTLFWIPIVPLNRVGEIVECALCHSQFEPGVTDRATTAELSHVLGNAIRALTAMIVRTAEPSMNPSDARTDAMSVAAVTHVRSAEPGYDLATLRSDVASLDPALASAYVAPLAQGLEVTGKEGLLAELTRVALAGGTITADQRRVIDQAGRGLGLTPAHVTGIVSSVVAARSPEPGPDLRR